MEENSILARVPGEYVGLALNSLPPAETAEDRIYEVEIDAGHAGRVRIYARRYRYRHRKNSYWTWSAVRAEAVS